MMETNRAPQSRDGELDFTAEQMSAYFLELDRLLDRVERSATHYQVLGLDRSATLEQIKQSYHDALRLVYPEYKIGATIPDQMLARMEQAFEKASRAFSILASFPKRMLYDETLAVKPSRLVGQSEQQGAQSARAENGRDVINIGGSERQKRVYSESSGQPSADNRRRCERFRLAIPARLTGHDRKAGKWHEMAETVDVSRTGVTVRMRRRVRHGEVLYLTLPMPTKLRQHGYTEPGYAVYALVRRVEPPKKGGRVVGLEFIGQHPPKGYLDNPLATFRTREWSGAERRRSRRIDRVEVIAIEYFTESMQTIAKETARTENISSTGMRACVREAPADFEMLRVSCPGRGFESFAIVTNRFAGKDGFERLCLRFLDSEWSV